jgi:hypothetical protein
MHSLGNGIADIPQLHTAFKMSPSEIDAILSNTPDGREIAIIATGHIIVT